MLFFDRLFKCFLIRTVFCSFLLLCFGSPVIKSLPVDSMLIRDINKVYIHREEIAEQIRFKLTEANSAEDSAKIYCQLVNKLPLYKREERNMYSIRAMQFVDRISDTARLVSIYGVRGLSLWLDGDPEQGYKYFKKALQLALENNLDWHAAWDCHYLALISIDQKNYEQAIDFVNLSKSKLKASGHQDLTFSHSDQVLIHLIPQNKKALMKSLKQETLKFIKTTTDIDQKILAYVNLIQILEKEDNDQMAMEYSLKALKLAEDNNKTTGLYRIYRYIGKYFGIKQNNLKVAMEYLDKSYQIGRENENTDMMTDVFLDKGVVYLKNGKDSLAKTCFNSVLVAIENRELKEEYLDAYKYLGDIFMEERNYEQAIRFYKEALTMGCDLCGGIQFHPIYLNLGKLYSELDSSSIALDYLYRSLNLADSMNAHSEVSMSLMALSDHYSKQGNLKQSYKLLNKALEEAELSNTPILIKEVYHKLGIVSKETGNLADAVKFMEMYQLYADTVAQFNKTEFLAQLETRFEIEHLKLKQELETTKSRQQILKQKQNQKFLVAGLLSVCFIVGLLFIALRRKRRDNLKLQKQKREIEEQKQQIQAISEKMDKVNKLKINFLTNISHELRTPLTVIIGLTEQMEFRISDAFSKKKISDIKRNAGKLSHLVNQMLDLRRLDEGEEKVKLTHGNIVSFISRELDSLRSYADVKGIDLIVQKTEEDMTGIYDPDKLEKIITNLVSNAIKFSKKGDQVIVELKPDDENNSFIKINVYDTGIGIPPDQQEYIFKPFFQASNNTQGSGIGLALTKELIELMHGSIHMKSEPDKGTCFTIHLPIDIKCFKNYELLEETHEMDKTEKNASFVQMLIEDAKKVKDTLPDNTKDLSGKTNHEHSILIVEDNNDLLEYMYSVFKDHYQIYKASNGIKGMDLAFKEMPDLIISDIMMPEMNGIQLCEKIKTDFRTSHIPLILLTAKATEKDKLEGLEYGADDYITKPFSINEIKIRVRKIIEQREKLREKFVKEFLFARPEEITPNQTDQLFLERVIHIVETNFKEPDFSVANLVDQLGMSRTLVFQKLKKLTNQSASQIITAIRIKKSIQLIQTTSKTISETSYDVGFNDPAYFTRVFKEVTGKTPSEIKNF